MRYQIKEWVIEKILKDGELFGKVASASKVVPSSLFNILKRNDPRLTQKDVLEAISSHLKRPEKDLLEKVTTTDSSKELAA